MQFADEEITGWQRNPKVSIIIPVYDGSDFLREAIDSALGQTYPNIEILVINDGSNDEGMTERVALSYGARVNYCHKENGGVASALNVGIRMMSGDLFSWLSHDDVYYPEKIAAQVAELQKLPYPSVLYSDYEVIDYKSQVIKKVLIQHYSPDKFRQALICDNPIHGCSALVPRICFEHVGLFNEGLRTTQDYDLWFRMAKKFEFHHIPVILLKSREHSKQGTVTMSSLHIHECNIFLVSGMQQLVMEKFEKKDGKDSIEMLMATCAISFRKRGFSPAAKYAYKEFKQSVGWLKILMFSHYRSQLLTYLNYGVKNFFQLICPEHFRRKRYSV